VVIISEISSKGSGKRKVRLRERRMVSFHLNCCKADAQG